MKQNVDALLRARGQTRKDLAVWCRKTESWISKIMKEDQREFPMKYFDRIADFFGIATYQLLQPGITSLTERRTRLPRRQVRDRRVSQLRLTAEAAPQLTVSLEPEEVAAIQRRRLLLPEDRRKLEETERAALDAMRKRPRDRPNTKSDASNES